MKKFSIILFVAALSLVFWGSGIHAQMAKEGSGEYRSARCGTFEVLAMGNERMQMNFQETGLVFVSPKNSPFYNASLINIGSLYAVKGKWQGSGFNEWTCTNGDKIYLTFQTEGTFGKGMTKGTGKIVGGTGAYKGIQGTLEFAGGPPVKPAKKGTYQKYTIGTISWKIP